MNQIDKVYLISPRTVLEQVSKAIPVSLHKNIIIIGSLAAGYYFFGEDEKFKVRTKDVDCLLSPRIEAIPVGQAVTDQLFAEGWQLRTEGDWGKPGNASTPENHLPAVRLYPPGSKDWFIELLTVSESEVRLGRRDNRLITSKGHFNLCSFDFLSLTEFKPIVTPFGIAIARPEMMALANLLVHPDIRPETMSGSIFGRLIKRSNKDLGRALAIAHLSIIKDEDALLKWPAIWKVALQEKFPMEWRDLTKRIGNGLKKLLNHPNDFEEARHTCINGLLALTPPSSEQLFDDGRRLLSEAIDIQYDVDLENVNSFERNL